jgi:signal transduction histidine kinase/tetratricopeptide (TPR) repeat protein
VTETTTKKPAFLGQALLILLPVLVLLAVGLNSLRQDKLLAHREAAERADRLANALLVEVEAALAATETAPPRLTVPAFQVDASSQLLFPPPIRRGLNPKPLRLSILTGEQARFWRTAQACEARGNEPGAAVEAYRTFLSLRPPGDFAANATYSLGLLLAARGDAAAAVEQFNRLIQDQPDAATESGLLLETLARLKVLEFGTNLTSASRGALFDSFCSNVVNSPTLLSAALLREAARFEPGSGTAAGLQKWTQVWHQHERARALFAAALPHLSRSNGVTPRACWFTFLARGTNAFSSKQGFASQPGVVAQNWLAFRGEETPAGCWFRCWTESQVVAALRTMAARAASLSDYLAIDIAVDGKTLVSARAPAGADEIVADEPHPEVLASASRSEHGDEWLRVAALLNRPALLYSHQRSRRFWFGSLIVISAATALTGLLASWRAFQRQERLGELKSNFVSSVSHELRTPLAAVRLLVDGLESGKVSGPWKQRQYLRLISQECRRLSGLIENILDYSRIEQGRKQFEFEPTDVVALTEKTVRIIEPFAAERNVSLALAIATFGSANSNPRALLDGRAIEQALLNLIDNAIKHSPEGQTVTVGVDWAGSGVSSLAVGDQRMNRVELWVEDHGGGIPPGEQEKIFERFYRRGSELRRETQGVGIGLSIVKHIVEAHGGRVRVRSAEGQGSRFSMELPLNHQVESPSHACR